MLFGYFDYFFLAVFFVVAAFLAPAFTVSWWLMRFLQIRKYTPRMQRASLRPAFYAGAVVATAPIRVSASWAG